MHTLNSDTPLNTAIDLELHHRFPILEQTGIYLNHAAMGPWCRDSYIAVTQFAEENLHQGARNYGQWMQLETQLHSALAAFVGAASTEDIALCKNTSEGLSLIAQGINWQLGDEVVIPDIEFPSNRLCWLHQQARGVTVHEVTLAHDDPESSLIDACTAKTRLLSVSAVQYGAGLRLDLVRLGRFCREQGILFCVDGIQQLGAIPLNVQETQCDFLVADAHKWLLGPEGIAVFYSSTSGRAALAQQQVGWRMYLDPFNFERENWSVPTGARRFEIGSPNMLGIFALSAVLRMFNDYGQAQVEKRLQENMQVLFEGISALPEVSVLSDSRSERRSGIISFVPQTPAGNRKGIDSDELQRRLLQCGLFGAQRGTGIRWSPHFYQSPAQMTQAVEVLKDCLRAR